MRLRRILGQQFSAQASTSELTWQSYQLMAGTADALPSLLHLSKQADTHEARLKIYAALEEEYALQRARDDDPAAEIELLWKLLPLAHRLGKLWQHETALERALELAVGDLNRYAAFALLKAELDQNKGRHEAAVKGLEAAIMASESGPIPRRFLLVLHLARTLQRQGQIEKARKLFKDFLALIGRRETTSPVATCHYHLGEIARREHDLESAERHHARALKIRRGLEPVPVTAIAVSLVAHGDLAEATGDGLRAIELYRQAKADLGEEDEVEHAMVERGLGRAHAAIGDVTSASHHFRQALAFIEGRGDIVGEEGARIELAGCQLELGQVEAALDDARLAAFRFALLPACTARGDAELLLGRIHFRGGQLAEAEAHFHQASRIYLGQRSRERAALASSWLLQTGQRQNDRAAVLTSCADLEGHLKDLDRPRQGELLFFRLFSALKWLRDQKETIPDPIEYLVQAHQELLRKLRFLSPNKRHHFLFNVRLNEVLLNVAMEHGLSLPSFPIFNAGDINPCPTSAMSI